MPPPQGTWNPIEDPGDYSTTKTVHDDTYPAIDPLKADLAGKMVFVAGASRGLGRSIAISFARAGASQIAIGARSGLDQVAKDLKSAAVEAGRKEPDVLTLTVNIADEESVSTAVGMIYQTFGKIDVLINNAAVIGDWISIGASELDSWWNTLTINVKGPYLTMRACLPLLLKSELKAVGTVASVGAFIVSPGLSAYQISKLAVLRLTQFFAAENADQGVIAFNVHPGNILTDMMPEGIDPELKKVFTETPELVADSLVYLVKKRREWISGRYINCTWDLPDLMKKQQEIVEKDLLKVTLALPA